MRAALYWLTFAKWCLVVGWRAAGGRWFIFRDAPTWFVAAIASCDWQYEDDDTRAIGEQAQAEIQLRMRSLARDVEASVGRGQS